MRNLLKELLQCTDKELENQLKAWDAKSLREFLVLSISQQDRQTKKSIINVIKDDGMTVWSGDLGEDVVSVNDIFNLLNNKYTG